MWMFARVSRGERVTFSHVYACADGDQRLTGVPPFYFFQSLSFTQHEALVWLDWSASELWLLVSSFALLPVLRLQTCAWLAFHMGDGDLD